MSDYDTIFPEIFEEDPTNTYEFWRDVQAETHEQDEELIDELDSDSVVTEEMSEAAAEWLADPDNSYDIYMDSLCECE